MQLSKILEYGIEVFNDEEDKFYRWLIKPNLILDGERPISLMSTKIGIKRVREVLDRIEWSNFV